MDVAGHPVIYLSTSPAGAVAEVFAPLATWGAQMFVAPSLPRARRSIAKYELAARASVLDLDDVDVLRELGLRPSAVASRDRSVTQAWAARIIAKGGHAGVRWWSSYDARWYSYGIWDRRHLKVTGVEPLSVEHPAVVEAAELLRRPRD